MGDKGVSLGGTGLRGARACLIGIEPRIGILGGDHSSPPYQKPLPRVLTHVDSEHPIPKLILEIRFASKDCDSYITPSYELSAAAVTPLFRPTKIR